MFVAGMVGGAAAAIVVTGIVMAVMYPNKFPWSTYLQSSTVLLNAMAPPIKNATQTTTRIVLDKSLLSLVVIFLGAVYYTVSVADGTAHILQTLDAMNASVGNFLMMIIEIILWVWRVVYESIVPITNAVSLILSDTVSQLVSSIMDCGSVDGKEIIMTLLLAPVRGFAALLGEWSTWLSSGQRQDGTYDFKDSVYVRHLDVTPGIEELIDKPVSALATAASCSCTTLAPVLANVAAIVSQPATKKAIYNAVNVPIALLQMLLRLAHPGVFEGLDMKPLGVFLRRAVYFGIAQIDGVIELVLSSIYNTAALSGAGAQHNIRLLDMGGPATAVAHAVVGAGSLALPVFNFVSSVFGPGNASVAEIMDVAPAMAHVSASVHVAAANVAWLQALVLHQSVLQHDSDPVTCPVFPVDFTSPRFLQKPQACHCQLQAHACNLGRCTPQGNCVCTSGAVHLVPDHVHSPCVPRCVVDDECGPSGSTCRLDGRCECSGANGLRIVYELGGDHMGRCTAQPASSVTNERPVVHKPEDLDFLYEDGGKLCGPGTHLVPAVGGALPCVIKYAGDAVLSTVYALYEVVRVGLLDGEMEKQIALGRPTAVIENYAGLAMPRALQSYGTCAQRRDFPVNDFTYGQHRCLCDVPRFDADATSLLQDHEYDPWCGVPTIEQGLAAVDHAVYYSGVGLVIELPIESTGLEALAEIYVGMVQTTVEVVRTVIGAGLMVFQQAFGVVLHAENLLLHPVNCQVGMPYDGELATPAQDAADATRMVAAACPPGRNTADCRKAETIVQAMGATTPTDDQLRQVAELASAAKHEAAFDACSAFSSSFLTPLCVDSNYGPDPLDCMCNPELEIRYNQTLQCLALNRVPPGTVIEHALGSEPNRLAWHRVYNNIGRDRITRAMNLYEWVLYRVNSVGVAVEALVDAFGMKGKDNQCNEVGAEQYQVSGHTTLSVFYEIDAKSGNIRLRSLMQGLVYDPESGQLRRDTSANAPKPFSPCTDGDAPPSNVCPVVAYDNMLCGGGASARTLIQTATIAVRQVAATGLGVLSVNPSALDVEFGALMCQVMREEAIIAGVISSALAAIVDVAGKDSVARQIRRALARCLFTLMDALINVWAVLLNILTSALNGLVTAGSFDLTTVYSMVLMVFDFWAAITCQLLEAMRLLFESFDVDASFLQGVKDVLSVAVQYINGQLLEFMIVLGRYITHFLTFVFAQTPSFSTVIKDLLLVVGVIIRFVANNVFTILKILFSLLPGVGSTISNMISEVCEGLFGFLSLIVDGLNHVPFVSLNNPFDPTPCVRRRLMAAAVANVTSHHVHFARYWDSWVSRDRKGPDETLWRGTGPCALAMHGEQRPSDAIIESCLRNRAFVGRVRHKLGVPDVPFDVLDGLRPAALYAAGVAQVLLSGGNWAAAARLGLPVQSARALYEGTVTVFERAAEFLGPHAWKVHVVPRLWPTEDVRNVNSTSTGATMYRALGALENLGHDIAKIKFHNRTAEAPRPIATLNRTAGTGITGARRRLGAAGNSDAIDDARPVAHDADVFDAQSVVLAGVSTTVDDEQCPSKLLCTRCGVLDALLGSIVRYSTYVISYYGANGQLGQTFKDFNEFFASHSHRIKVHNQGGSAPPARHSQAHDGDYVVGHDGRDGGADDAGVGFRAAASAHENYGDFARTVGMWFVSGDGDARLAYGLGQPLLPRFQDVMGPCNPGSDGGSFGCDAPRDSVGSAMLWAAVGGYLARRILGGGVLSAIISVVTYLRARYGWVPRCGLAVPTCVVRDLQVAVQSVLVPCVCERVPPQLLKPPGCDRASCFFRTPFDPLPQYRDCPVVNPLQYPLRLWRHVSPVTFYGVMAPLFADVRALGLANQLRDVKLGLPLDPVSVTCDVYLGLPVSLGVLLVIAPVVSGGLKLVIGQIPVVAAAINMGFTTSSALVQVVEDDTLKDKIQHGGLVYLNAVLVVAYVAAVVGGTNHATHSADAARAVAVSVLLLHLVSLAAMTTPGNAEAREQRRIFMFSGLFSSMAALLYATSVVAQASSVYVTFGTLFDAFLAALLALSDYALLRQFDNDVEKQKPGVSTEPDGGENAAPDDRSQTSNPEE